MTSYIPRISWHSSTRKIGRELGAIRDTRPAEQFIVTRWGADEIVLSIGRVMDISTPEAVLGKFATVDEAKAAAEAHLDKGPTRDDRTTYRLFDPVLRGRIEHIREMCNNTANLDVSTAGLSDRAWLARNVLNVLDGTIDDQIRTENQL